MWKFGAPSSGAETPRKADKEWISLFIDLQMKANKTSPPPSKKKKNPTSLFYVSKADSISRLARSPLTEYYPTPITRTVPRLRSVSLQ